MPNSDRRRRDGGTRETHKAREHPRVINGDRWRRRRLRSARGTRRPQQNPRRKLTYDRLLRHRLLGSFRRPPFAYLFRHWIVRTVVWWPRHDDVKDGKKYPNANSCLMFTFSVVVIHCRAPRWPPPPPSRTEPTAAPVAADGARRGATRPAIGTPAAVRDVTDARRRRSGGR